MALASFHVGIVSHSEGRFAVAAAAYSSASKLRNEYDGQMHDYTRKSGVVFTAIFTPANAPEWSKQQETLWNQHQKADIKKNGFFRDDAQLARTVTAALPREFTDEQNIRLAGDLAQIFVKQGMIADVSIHDTRDGNPHMHILLTMRAIDADGFSSRKNQDWGKREYLIGWRQAYQDITNRHLELNGFDERICVDSYEKQGIDKTPTIHMGKAAYHMEKRWIQTERGDINREIQKANRERAEIGAEIAMLEKEQEAQKVLEDRADYYSKVNEEVRSTAEMLEPERFSYQDRSSTTGHQPQNRFSEQQQQNRFSPPKRTAQPNRPPPLRRQTREDRNLAGERSRQRSQGKRKQFHHILTEDTESRRKMEYDRLYENPPTKQGQESHHHTRDPSSERERKTDFDSLYEKPPVKQDQKPETHSHAPTHRLNRKTDFDTLYEKPDNEATDHPRPERNKDGPEKEK